MSNDHYRLTDLLVFILVVLITCVALIIIDVYPEQETVTLILKESIIPTNTSNMGYRVASTNDMNRLKDHLKFRFVYTTPSDCYDKLKSIIKELDNIKELFRFNNNNDEIVCFFVTNDIDVDVNPETKKSVVEHPYKMYDTYVM